MQAFDALAHFVETRNVREFRTVRPFADLAGRTARSLDPGDAPALENDLLDRLAEFTDRRARSEW
jgi:hypothetical protein